MIPNLPQIAFRCELGFLKFFPTYPFQVSIAQVKGVFSAIRIKSAHESDRQQGHGVDGAN